MILIFWYWIWDKDSPLRERKGWSLLCEKTQGSLTIVQGAAIEGTDNVLNIIIIIWWWIDSSFWNHDYQNEQSFDTKSPKRIFMSTNFHALDFFLSCKILTFSCRTVCDVSMFWPVLEKNLRPSWFWVWAGTLPEGLAWRHVI